jgi:hypothetical protein
MSERGDIRNILLVANETVVGRALIEALERRREGGEISVHVICPQSEPKHGYVVYDETVRDAAENRLAMTLAQLREIGVEATGEVMDPDPHSAIADATGEHAYDEVIVSTHPQTRSGWLRQDLVTRVEQTTGLPVEHVVVDLDVEGDELICTLVVANQTVGGQPLLDQLHELAAEASRRFVLLCPQTGELDEQAHARLAHTLHQLEQEGLAAIGQVTHPDPYTATMNALDFYGIDEIVISTLPETSSGWLRGDLVGRLRGSTSKPVHHVISDEQVQSVAAPPDSGGSAS